MMKSWKETGKFFERAGTGKGRKRKSSKRQDRVLVRFSLVNRHFTSSDMWREWHQSSGVKLALSTVRTRWLRFGLRGCKTKRKSKVTKKQKIRIAWANKHLNWSLRVGQGRFQQLEHLNDTKLHWKKLNLTKTPWSTPFPVHIAYCKASHLCHDLGLFDITCHYERLHICDGMMNSSKYTDVLKSKLLPSARVCLGKKPGYIRMIMLLAVPKNKISEKMDAISWSLSNELASSVSWSKPHQQFVAQNKHGCCQRKTYSKRELIEKIIFAWYHNVTPKELRRIVHSMPRR